MAQVPPLQNVCVFCTARVQFAALYPQRRLFRSGNSIKKPPAVAAAQEDEDTNDIGISDTVEPTAAPNRNPDRWKRWPPVRDSGRDDQRSSIHRDTRNESRGDLRRHQWQGEVHTPQPTQLESPASHFLSASRNEALAYHAGALKASQAGGGFWKCQCGQQNPRSNTEACTRCRAPAPNHPRGSQAVDPEDPSVVQGWKHIQRIGDHEHRDAPSDGKAEMPEISPARPQLEEARRKRFEQSKEGHFVGLEAAFKKADLNLDFQEVRKPTAEAPGANTQSIHNQTSSSSNEVTESSQDKVGTKHKLVRSHYAADDSNLKRDSFQDRRDTQRLDELSLQRESRGGWRRFTPASSERTSRDQENPVSNKPLPNHTADTGSRELYEPSLQREPRRGWRKLTPESSERTSSDQGKPVSDSPMPNRSVNTRPRWSSDDTRADTAVFTTQWTALKPPQKDAGVQNQSLESTHAPTRSSRTQNRMARRLQELEEEQYAKPSRRQSRSARFDFSRESRASQLKTRKALEQQDALRDEDEFNEARQARRERKQKKKQQQSVNKGHGPPTPIYLPEFISVVNLAGALHIKLEDFINRMADLGFENINNDHILDAETAGLIASEFNFEPVSDRTENQDLVARPPAEDKSLLPPRPPVVTIMGHVDHGKTTLLDWLRKSSVAATEHGGITQHIGAFSVPMPSGRTITFLDTPGHAAFLDMRQRGANVTDIVILVVAADDSVKPQTIEALKHAQAAQVPMIVAVNKIDKEDADVDRVKQDLARHGVEIEDYGGETQVVCVSGKTGQGMETLEESAVALADVLDMRAEVDGLAEGWVLEATTKKAGRVATVLVRRGTLHPGDIIVAGTTWTRVRTLRNEADISVESAGPGTPVEVDGWKDQPMAGDEVLQADTEQHARSVIDMRLEALERTQLASDMIAVNEARRLEQERREAIKAAEAAAADDTSEDPEPPSLKPKETKESYREIPLLVKADVSGSVEAVLASVLSLGNANIRPTVIRSGVGAVSEFDVSYAASAQAHLICFNVGMDQNIRRLAESAGVNIVEQTIIYRLADAVKSILESNLEPLRSKRVLGEAEVAMVFDINVRGRRTVPVAGCKIRNGVVAREKKVMVRRGGEVVYDGSLSSLKNRKQDVSEMRKGTECGISFDAWTDFRVGDLVQSYEETVEKRTL
ncbi:MAG: hypothetical protein Q9191_007926 [Dirinaria sp. TL-2023a]